MVQNESWTVAAPFKEQKHVRTAVESIANNFSPQAQRLDIRKLPQAKQTTPYPGDGYYRGGKELPPHSILNKTKISLSLDRFLEKGKKLIVVIVIVLFVIILHFKKHTRTFFLTSLLT